MWATIENSSGTLQGGGPITNIESFSLTKRLDKAGNFQFTMPLSDDLADDLSHKYIVRFYDIINSTTTEIGAGIIENIRTQVNPTGAPMLSVSGDGMLAQLANLPIGNLDVFDTDEYAASAVVFHEDGSTYNNWNDAETDDANYDYSSTGWGSNDDLYIGYSSAFDRVKFDFTTMANTDEANLSCEYYDGSNWIEMTIVSDGTESSSIPWAQDGTVQLQRMSDWATTTINSNGPYYYVRFSVDESLDVDNGNGRIEFRYISVVVESPTASALSDIMTVAPVSAANWDVDASYHSEAENEWYGTFRDETSVLAALRRLAAQTGEHFRYEGVDTAGDGDDEIAWLQDDETATSYRAIRAPLSAPTASDDNLCYILSLTETENSYDLVTRVHPYGAGTGNLRLDISETGYTAGDMPANYTLDTSNNLIKSDTPDTAYGRHDRTVLFADIGANSSNIAKDSVAADALVDAALAWLQKHDSIVTSYNMSIVGFPSLPKVGQLIPVVYERWVDGTKIMSVDASLWIMDIEFRLDNSGALVANLTVADKDVHPSSDADTLAGNIDTLNSVAAHSPGGSTGTTASALGGALQFVPLQDDNKLTSTDFDGDAFSTTAKTQIDLSSSFSAPPRVEAVYLDVAINDSDSENSDCWIILGDDSDVYDGQALRAYGMPNDEETYANMIVPCDDNGDIYYQCQATGTDTLDIRIWIRGYWI